MKTIAQQLGITEFPFEIKDKNGNRIYWESFYGFWKRMKYNSNNKEIHFENSAGYWRKTEYNDRCQVIYIEDSDDGVTLDKRINIEVTLDEVAEKFGILTSQLRIKD